MTKPAPQWMYAQSQDLSLLALLLAAGCPGLAAFLAALADVGYWAAVAIFVVLQAAAIALVRRDSRLRRTAIIRKIETRSAGQACSRLAGA
jgi:membrane protein implicated in regulation of membrane protease activity